MTKKEAKENFGKWVKSPVRFEKNFLVTGIDSKQWAIVKKPVIGILIGTRTYRNGNTDYGEGCHFTMTSCFEVGLIVPSWRNKPVPVPLKEIN